MSVALLFFDGVGIGEDDPEKNPLARYRSKFFRAFIGGDNFRAEYDGIIVPTDATLNIPGYPQSATGQTAIFTGVNAAEMMQAHINGLPTPTLRKILLSESIFLKLKKLGKRATFANAYSKHYFEIRGERLSATTYAVMASQVPFRWYDKELQDGKAVPADLTGEFLKRFYPDVKIITPEESGKIIADLLCKYDFVMYEFPFTDEAGHNQDFELALKYIDRIERFLDSLLTNTNLDEHLIILTSDHGNIEDLSIKTHTLNKVPTIIWGKGKEKVAMSIKSLLDITPAIIKYLTEQI
ncbi:MAG: alkaline phosphatase family protein [Candidatus Kryptonium sp.]